jgi:hypothetical protein
MALGSSIMEKTYSGCEVWARKRYISRRSGIPKSKLVPRKRGTAKLGAGGK